MSKRPFTCVEKRNWEKLTLKNCYSINFGLWAEKTWTFSKTVMHDFQNCSPRVQGNNFGSFSEAKKTLYESFRTLNGKVGVLAKIFTPGWQRRISHVQCNTLRKDNESKLYFLWLVYDSECIFFNLTGKLVGGVKPTN